MIGVVGHADLTAATLELLESELQQRLAAFASSGAVGLARVGAGLPVVFARAARKAGLGMVVVLPSQDAVPAPLPERDALAAGEMLLLAQHARLLDFDPRDRDARVTADENHIESCQRLLAVWDGSWSTSSDPTAHLVAYARSRGVPVEVVWPAGATRAGGGPLPSDTGAASRQGPV